MKKRILSFVTVLAMIISLVPEFTVSAYDIPSEFDVPEGVTWYSNKNSDGQEYIPGETYVLEASSAYKANGNHSLHLAAPTEYNNVQIRIGLDLKKALSTSETYRITGKAVRFSEYGLTTWWDNVQLRYGTSLQSLTKVGTVTCSDNYETKGFGDFSFDITPTTSATMLVLYTWQGNYYIDDMSCRKVNSDGTLGEELLVNGGFEKIVGESDGELPEGVTWYSNKNSDGQEYIPGETYVLEASSAYKASGNYSLHLAAPTEYNNVQIRIGLDLKNALSTSETYRITGKAVRFSEYGLTTWWDNIQLRYGTSLQSLTKVGTVTCSDNYETKGFGDYSFDITPTTSATMLVLYTWQGNYYIDDMSCRRINSDGTLGEELLVNGGFEFSGNDDEYTEYNGEYAEYDPSAVKYPAHWQGLFNSDSSTMIGKDTFIASTDIMAHSGKRAMLIQVKEQSTAGERYSVLTDLSVKTDSSRKYRLEFYQKGLSGTADRVRASVVKENGTVIYENGLWELYETSVVDSSGWRKYSYDFAGQALTSIGLQLSSSNAFLIDDMKLYEVDGNTLKEIEIKNGDFEDYLDFNDVPSEETYNDNWHVAYYGPAGVVDDSVRYEDIGNGNYAMHTRYDETKAGNVYVAIENNISNGQIVSGNKYTVEYDIKASSRGEGNAVFFFPLRKWNYNQSFGIDNSATNNSTVKSITLLDNGFKHVVKEFTSSTSGNSVFAMLLQGQSDMLIDNIKVYDSADSSKTNLIGDGDFSGTVTVDKSGLEKVNIYQSSTNKLTVAWTNPPVGIESAKIYVNDKEQETDINLTSGAYNETVFSGFVKGESCNIKVEAQINGVRKTYTKNIIISENDKEQADYSKSLKVLAIGNSFSVDALEHFYQIADSYGIDEIKIGNLYIGGCALSEHWNNAVLDSSVYTYYKNTTGSFTSSTSSIKNALTDEDWDVIVMQQVSGLSGVADSYEPYLSKLRNYINDNKTNPDAKLAWHMTWAYQNGASHQDFSKYDNSQDAMYNSIVLAVKGEVLPDTDIDYIIPSGTAIQNVRASYIGDTLTRDGYHLSYGYGRYIAALTWFKTLTGFDIDGISYAPSDVSAEYSGVAKEAVDSAVKNPFVITDMCENYHKVVNDNWTLVFNGMNGYAEDYAHVEDIGNGNYAMHIRYYDDTAANIYARLYSKKGQNLINGAKYIVEFDAKYNHTQNADSLVVFPFNNWDWDTTISNGSVTSSTAKDSYGWYHYKKEFTSTESVAQNVNIVIQSKCDAYIDNIKVYASDDASKTNLVVDGDFQSTQSGDTEYPIIFDKAEQYAEFSCELYHENASDNANIVLFEGVGGNGTIFKLSRNGLTTGTSVIQSEAPDGWYKLDAVMDYENGMLIKITFPDGGTAERMDYSFLKGSTGVEKITLISSEGKYRNVSYSTQKPTQEPEKQKTRAEITGITKSGNEVTGFDGLSANDNVTVNIDYFNNTDVDCGLTVIAAYYDESGRLISAETSATDTIDGAVTERKLSYQYTIANYENADEMVLYTWDSLSGMKPLGKRYSVGDNKFTDSQLLHIATTFYGDEGTTRGFAWSTTTAYTDMVIQYAESDKDWDTYMTEKSVSYEAYNSRYFYKTYLDNLQPGETYTYRVGDIDDNLWSDYYTFTTEPENVEKFSFIGITDPQSGAWDDGYEYMKMSLDKAMEDAPGAAFMVNTGDLTDSGSSRTQYDYYFNAAEGYSEILPHMTVVGNHCNSDGGKLMGLHFNNPVNGYDALGDLTKDDMSSTAGKAVIDNFKGSVYSFDYGDVHFAVLNSGPLREADTLALLSPQAEWLRKDLEESDKKWKIVMLHMSLYPALERYSTKSVLLDVIDECGVDLVLTGHDHMVTRTYPMRNDQIVTKTSTNIIEKGTGTVYSILGCAGPKRYDYATKTPEYAVVLSSTRKELPTYSVFTVDEDSIDVITKQINGMVVDEFTIVE